MSDVPVDLGYRPRPWQTRLHAARRRSRFLVVATHRRAGKTEAALAELVDGALRTTADAAVFIYCAPFLVQARTIAWSRLRARVMPLVLHGAATIRESELSISFANGSLVRLAGADNSHALRGLRIDGLVVDEVAQIRPDVWTDVLQPALSDRKGWAMFIGTPFGQNLFSELFNRGIAGVDGWAALSFPVDATDALDRDEVQRLRRDMPEQSFAREYLCSFEAAADNQLIALSMVEEAAKRTYKAGDILRAPRVIGVDVARFGDDRSVIARRQGLVAFPPTVLKGVDNMVLAARVADALVQWDADACFIDSGGGAGVIDRLRQLGHQVIEVPFGGRALQPTQFKDRRSEMWHGMAEWLTQGGSIPDDLALKTELSTPTYTFDSSGRRVLESKEDIKKRLLGAGSPDIADALALTFAAPVAQRRLDRARQDVLADLAGQERRRPDGAELWGGPSDSELWGGR